MLHILKCTRIVQNPKFGMPNNIVLEFQTYYIFGPQIISHEEKATCSVGDNDVYVALPVLQQSFARRPR